MIFQCIVPQRFYSERTYALKHLLEETFHCTLLIQSSENEFIELIYGGKTIVLKDSFFGNKQTYLHPSALPQSIAWFTSVATSIKTPLLFGRTHTQQENSVLTIDHDFVASAFVMLSRLEEIVAPRSSFDEIGRFKAVDSIAFKNNFIKIPIVDVYALELAHYIQVHFGVALQKRTQFNVQATCDVDFIEKWPTLNSKLKSLAGDLMKRKSLQTFKATFRAIVSGKNPYDTFDYLLQLSKKNQVPFIVYWLVGGEKDARNNRNYLATDSFKKALNQLQQHKVTMGLHPALGSTQNTNYLKQQLVTLQKALNAPLYHARQHYLQSSFPETWQQYSALGLSQSSNSYFSEQLGFRSGTTLQHKVFDCINRIELNVREQPLCLMDVTLLNMLENNTLDKVKSEVAALISTVKHVDGTLCFLWHNHTIEPFEWQPLQGILVDLFSCNAQ